MVSIISQNYGDRSVKASIKNNAKVAFSSNQNGIEKSFTEFKTNALSTVNSLIHPEDPKGKLIKGYKLGNTPANEVINSAKTFWKILNNKEVNDYSIGKINDGALIVSGIGIATTLAVGAPTPFHAAMEFVGLGCWIGAMSVFPKVAIGKTVQTKFGFDPFQEYTDSYDRRKRFFEDPQYLPWDLYSDKELNTIGDKLKIPQDIKDRKAAIQDKMKQIAVQSHTLWMLTAGLATPLVCSVTADLLQAPTKDLIDSFNFKNATKRAKESGIQADCSVSNVKHSVDPLRRGYNKVIDGIAEVASRAYRQGAKAGNAVTGMFKGNPEVALDKLMKNNASKDDIVKFFERKLGNSRIKDEVVEKLKTLDLSKSDEVKKLLTETMDAKKFTKLFDNVANGGKLDNFWGTRVPDLFAQVTELFTKNPLKNRETRKKIAEAVKNSDTNKIVDIFAEHLEGMAKTKEGKVKLQTALARIARMQDRAMSIANPTEINLASINKKLIEDFKNIGLLQSIKNNTARLEIYGPNSQALFAAITQPIKLALKGDKDGLRQAIKGYTSADVANTLSKLGKAGRELSLNTIFGSAATKVKDAANKAVMDYAGLDNITVMNQIPRDIKGLMNLANQLGKRGVDHVTSSLKKLQDYKRWQIPVYIATAALLGTTVATVMNMGKKNEYNSDFYVKKEAAGNESK